MSLHYDEKSRNKNNQQANKTTVQGSVQGSVITYLACSFPSIKVEGKLYCIIMYNRELV